VVAVFLLQEVLGGELPQKYWFVCSTTPALCNHNQYVFGVLLHPFRLSDLIFVYENLGQVMPNSKLDLYECYPTR